jgi:predicted lipid carrier protein YhbT
MRLTRFIAGVGLAMLLAAGAHAQDACKQRGELDTPFCDEDGDLLADMPRDPKRHKNPDTLFFNRRLSMEGDTELGLVVKNTLDALELPVLDPKRWSPRQVLARFRRPAP